MPEIGTMVLFAQAAVIAAFVLYGAGLALAWLYECAEEAVWRFRRRF